MAEDDRGVAVGIRHQERRWRDRRRHARLVRDRRRSQRRRQRIQTFFLAAATAATPASFRTLPTQPGISVSMQDFRVGRPGEAYDDLIKEAALTYRLDPRLIRAVMRAESSFDPLVVSPVGAQGLMQLMPALAAELGVTDVFDPRQNIMAGSRYLRLLLDRHHDNLKLALASYNAGPGNVARYKGIPPFRETRNYVKKITRYLADAGEE